MDHLDISWDIRGLRWIHPAGFSYFFVPKSGPGDPYSNKPPRSGRLEIDLTPFTSEEMGKPVYSTSDLALIICQDEFSEPMRIVASQEGRIESEVE